MESCKDKFGRAVIGAEEGNCCWCQIKWRKSRTVGGIQEYIPLWDQPHAGLTIDCDESKGGIDWNFDSGGDIKLYIFSTFHTEKKNKLQFHPENYLVYDRGRISCSAAEKWRKELEGQLALNTVILFNCHLDSWAVSCVMNDEGDAIYPKQ